MQRYIEYINITILVLLFKMGYVVASVAIKDHELIRLFIQALCKTLHLAFTSYIWLKPRVNDS